MIKATWKSGYSGIMKGDPQKIAEEILSIGDIATPQEIVSLARDDGTELHKCFTWDNDVAADKWRLHEARQICCNLVIVREEPELPEVRVFHRLTEAKGYTATARIVRDETLYSHLLLDALAELKAFQRKYDVLRNHRLLLDLIAEVDTMASTA